MRPRLARRGAAGGIALSSSPNCVIERNLLVGNKEGFNFREQNRATPRIDDRSLCWVWNHDQIIRNNVVAYNRNAQTWGWFDLCDGRHWPAAMQSAEEKEAGRTAPHRAAGDKADRAQGDSAGPDAGKSQTHDGEQLLRGPALPRILQLGHVLAPQPTLWQPRRRAAER